jgi:hypothetical protein
MAMDVHLDPANWGDGDGWTPDVISDPAASTTPADAATWAQVAIKLPRILTGGELVRQSDRGPYTKDDDESPHVVNGNNLFLRNDVHGGDTRVIADAINDNYAQSLWGALAWTSVHPYAYQAANLLSVVDDYNGSHNPAFDKSYNADRAETIYVLQIYDYKEELFDLPPDEQIGISPIPPTSTGAYLTVIVDCLRTWVSEKDYLDLEDTVAGVSTTEVDDLSIDDLGLISDQILNGGSTLNADFAGLKRTLSVNEARTDASNGWIRLVRDNNVTDRTDLEGLGGTTEIPNTDRGDYEIGTFLTIGLQVLEFDSFGASWWMPTSAYDPKVADQGDPTPDPEDLLPWEEL